MRGSVPFPRCRDYLFGAIPIVGDLFDAVWKSNRKNVELLRQRATVSSAEAHSGRVSDWLFVGLIMLILLTLLIGSIAVSLYLLSLIIGRVPSPW